MPLDFKNLEVPDVIEINPKSFEDERGFFSEVYKRSDFHGAGIKYEFVQENHSKSRKRVLRGLHYQLNPKAQGKLVRVIRGKIFDVAVDMRNGSPYYGKWVGVALSDENRKILWIPPGFGHGYVCLKDNTEVVYKTTDEYASSLERGVIWNDPEIGIDWPIRDPIISSRDSNFPPLKEAENNFEFE